MSSFGALPIDAQSMPFDALIAASGKCIEGPPGMAFVIARRSALERAAGNSTSLSLDLHDQWQYMDKTTQWRYTPPTHVVAAFAAALETFIGEGGQPARLARYTRNYETLVEGMAELGFRPFLDPTVQAPIIVTFHAPADARYSFREFYDRVRDKGFILYPGKLTQVETFRVGCIGAIGPDEMRHAVNAVRDTLAEMDIARVAPASAARAVA
jgi:2-aminoethylphosphonate-pyruvate transaminase